MNLNNFYYRVDNLRHNSLVVKGVVKKAGSGLATPMMTAEQKEWWKKTVEKKTLENIGMSDLLTKKDAEKEYTNGGRLTVHNSRIDNIGDLVPPVAVFWYRRFTLSDFS